MSWETSLSSSVSFREIARKRKDEAEKVNDDAIDVCLISSDDECSSRRKLFKRSRYKFRPKTGGGVDRFNPHAKTPQEIARMKRREDRKRRRELEDDAASARKTRLDQHGALKRRRNIGSRLDQHGGSEPSLFRRRDYQPVPGEGKQFHRRCMSVHKAFARPPDDPLWKRPREDFILPYDNKAGDDSSSSSSSLVAVRSEPPAQGSNEFSTKLQEELSRPFSFTELDEKLEWVRRQKPVVRSRNLRGQRIIDFSTDIGGLSYLDHHPDFANALGKAVELRDKLKLLREFFFWIEHMCMEGSYTPWVKSGGLQLKQDENYIVIDDD